MACWAASSAHPASAPLRASWTASWSCPLPLLLSLPPRTWSQSFSCAEGLTLAPPGTGGKKSSGSPQHQIIQSGQSHVGRTGFLHHLMRWQKSSGLRLQQSQQHQVIWGKVFWFTTVTTAPSHLGEKSSGLQQSQQHQVIWGKSLLVYNSHNSTKSFGKKSSGLQQSQQHQVIWEKVFWFTTVTTAPSHSVWTVTCGEGRTPAQHFEGKKSQLGDGGGGGLSTIIFALSSKMSQTLSSTGLTHHKSDWRTQQFSIRSSPSPHSQSCISNNLQSW